MARHGTFLPKNRRGKSARADYSQMPQLVSCGQHSTVDAVDLDDPYVIRVTREAARCDAGPTLVPDTCRVKMFIGYSVSVTGTT